MKCPACGSHNIKDYGDVLHWKCKDCNWIFLKEDDAMDMPRYPKSSSTGAR